MGLLSVLAKFRGRPARAVDRGCESGSSTRILPAGNTYETFKADVLGATGVITVLEAQLTAPRVADLRNELLSFLTPRRGLKNLVIDMQNVEYLDSTCLYMLVHMLKQVSQRGGKIAVVSAHRTVEGLFKLTRLDQLFPIRRGVLEAVAAVER